MPTPWGTDNTDEDYAPHMYIQHKFVGGHPAVVEIDGIEYRVGVTEESGMPRVICETVTGKDYEKAAIAVSDFPTKARVKLLEYLASEDSINVDPEDQEHIRRAFGFPQRELEESLRSKRKSRDVLNDFVKAASGGRENIDSVKRRRSSQRKAVQ